MATDAEAEASGTGYIGRDREKDHDDDGFVDEDELFDELENEEIPSRIRDARMSEMKRQAEAARAMDKGLGLYSEIEKEGDVLKMTTTIPRVLIHFYHTDFRRCSIMDKHLKVLAEQYRDVKFNRVCVDVVPFFITKLQIQVLPAVLLFIDGIVVDRVVGFDELGNTDSFTTSILEKRLAQSGIIKIPGSDNTTNKTIFGFDRRREDDSSDEDY